MRRSNHGSFSTRRGRRVLTHATLVLAVLVAASSGVPAQPKPDGGRALTLSEALRRVAAASQQAVTSKLDVESARERSRQTESLYYPTIFARGGKYYRDNPIIAVFGTLEAPTTEQNYWEYQVGARQLVWDFGRRKSAVEASRSMETAVSDKGAASVFSAQLEGMGVYLKALSLKAQRKVVDQRITALKDHLRVVKDLYQQGLVARNDLLETEVRLRLVQDQASRVDNDEAVALQSLNRIMGLDPSAQITLPQGLPAPPVLADGVRRLKAQAIENNPDIKASEAALTAREDSVRFRKRDFYPSVIAEAGHTYQENKYLLFPHANYVFLGFSWDIFDGGVRSSKVRQAEIGVEKSRRELLEAKRSVNIAVDKAYRDYRQALLETRTAKTNVKAAKENLRIEEDQYKAGLAKTTDVLDAEAVLAQSRFALVAQHYSAYMKQGTLLSVMGEALPTFYENLPVAGQEH